MVFSFLKTILSFLILPFSFTVLLIAGGLALRYRKRYKSGKTLILTGSILLLFFASYPGSWLTLAPLERAYEPLKSKVSLDGDYVVVLGGGSEEDNTLPITSRLTKNATRRFTEGIRIHNQVPKSTLVLSGGSREDGLSTAEAELKLMHLLGLDTSSVKLLPDPLKTKQEAESVKPIVHDTSQVILVTSAFHMVRAVKLFKAQGIDVIPAPADHEIAASDEWGLGHFIWRPEYLYRSHRAFHEYVGLFWAWLKGDLSF